MPRLVIDDGWTLTKKTSPVGFAPAVTIKFRPAMPERVLEYREAATGSNPKRTLEATVKILADHLVSWDVEDGQGKTTAPTADVLERVPYPVLDQMVDAVAGYGKAWADEGKG